MTIQEFVDAFMMGASVVLDDYCDFSQVKERTLRDRAEQIYNEMAENGLIVENHG